MVMELIHKHCKMEGNDIRQLALITFKSLNKGLECSVKLEKVIILMAFDPSNFTQRTLSIADS